MVNFQRAGDIATKDLHVGLLLFGNPGAGKTHAASLAPTPFVLLTEKNGLTTVRRSNPDALVAICSDIGAVRDILLLAMHGELPDGCLTLVVDSLSEVQRLFRDEIVALKPTGKGDEFTLKDWGTLADKMRRFMRTLRDLPYNVVVTALAEATVADDGVRYMRPAFEGRKTGNEIAQYFNGVAYLYKRTSTADNGDELVEHFAMFDGPSSYVTKACHPLKGTMSTDVGEWYELLAKNPNTDAANAAKE